MGEQPGLTGVWDGLYSYSRHHQPTPFTAVIMEIGAAISGTIHETCDHGSAAGQTLNAMITGQRSGSAVQFVKTYDPPVAGYNKPVIYEGCLNSDATEIEETWRLSPNWSGKFLMIRANRPSEKVAERWEQLLPVD